jgi:alkylated DNA nucleotide flippase Atl1
VSLDGRGKVASYGTVSEVVRGDTDGSQHAAGLAANDASLPTAYRVVKRDGSVAAGFRWADGRRGGAEEGQHALEKEGVEFDARGRVLREYVLSVEELRELYKAER